MNDVGLTILGGLCILSVSFTGRRGEEEIRKIKSRFAEFKSRAQ